MMNRKVFLKALAALGLSGRLPKGDEVPKLANVTTRLSYRPDDARLREEHIRHEIKLNMPTSLEHWSELGLSPEEVNALAIKSYSVGAQMQARMAVKRDNELTSAQLSKIANAWRPFRHSRKRPI